jgi:hypothetical protein
VIVFAVLLYLELRWRKAPRAFKAVSRVAIASLAAGALLGVWSLHLLDAWTSTDPGDGGSTPRTIASASPTSSPSRSPIPVTPTGSGTTSSVAPSPILASYVGEALAQRRAKNTSAGSTEAWQQVDQGCRLGNYDRASILCRAATLAVEGWGDTRTVPFTQVVEFCDAEYLGEGLALCLTARNPHADDSTTTQDGIPASDVVRELRWHVAWDVTGPDGSLKSWTEITPLCALGVYASGSPVCEAAAVEKRGPDNTARVSYSEVASFCDVQLIRGDTEVCRAAYHFAQPKSGPER